MNKALKDLQNKGTINYTIREVRDILQDVRELKSVIRVATNQLKRTLKVLENQGGVK